MMFRNADDMARHIYEAESERLKGLERVQGQVRGLQIARSLKKLEGAVERKLSESEAFLIAKDLYDVGIKAYRLLTEVQIQEWEWALEKLLRQAVQTSMSDRNNPVKLLKSVHHVFMYLAKKEEALNFDVDRTNDEVKFFRGKLASHQVIVAATGMYGYTKAISSAGDRATKQLHKEAVRIAKAAYSKDSSVVDFLAKHAEKGGSRTARVLLKAMEDIGPRIPTLADKEASGARSLYGFRRKTADIGIAACSQLKLAAGDVAAALGDKWAKRYADMTGFLSRHAEEGQCLYAGMLVSCFPDGGSSLTKTASPASKLEDYLRQGAFGKAEEEAGRILQAPLTRDLTRLIPRLKANQTMGTNIKALVQALMASNS